MVLVVDHPSPVPATLEYGRVGADSMERVARDPQRHHVFALTGLTPDTEYRYRIVRDPNTATEEAVFRTLPEAPSEIHFVVMGDHRSQPDRWGAVATRILEAEPRARFAVGTGDYPSDGRHYGQWVEQFFEPGRALLAHLPLWPCIGNHERTRTREGELREEAPYFSLFDLPGNELWYRFDDGPVTCLVLDSNTSLADDSPQSLWLDEQLNSERQPFTFVFLHHSPYSSGPHVRLDRDGRPREWPVDHGRRYLAPKMATHDVDVVFSGHDHIYERSRKDGVVYLVTGGAGAPLYEVNSVPNPYQEVAVATYHYVTVDVTTDRAEITARAVDGTILDHFEVEARQLEPVR
jgi:hypothetical protein